MSNRKTLGQVFTPQWVVDLMLDDLNYKSYNPDILTQRILEPSFGEGIFLFEIVKRLITAGKHHNLDNKQIGQMISSNVWGVEFDKSVYESTLGELNALLRKEDIYIAKWNLYNVDALTFDAEDKFDLVVGNPPYVRIHNMSTELRDTAKLFNLSKGTKDVYILFFELGINLLNDTGRLSFITPNSFFRTTSPKIFRDYVVDNHLLDKITDFGSKIIFDGAATYTAITNLSKGAHKTSLKFSYRGTDNPFDNTIQYSDLGLVWAFTNPDDTLFMRGIKGRQKSLGDLLKVQYGISTLRDKLYTVLPENIEQSIVRKAIKGGRFKGNNYAQILFPYDIVDNKPVAMVEKKLQEYPVAYAYLSQHKEELLSRDIEKNGQWFQYGRSQGISHHNKRKLVFSNVISNNQTTIKAHIIEPETLVYAGFYITEQPDGLTLEEIQKIIETEEFCKYMKLLGKDMSGGFKAISPKLIKEFRI
jgi:adenine-specific DNA-methyltransferase